MKCWTYRLARFFSFCTLSLVLLTCGTSFCMTAETGAPATPPTNPSMGTQSVRSGGKLEQSYNYHRQSATQPTPVTAAVGSARSGGWYHYGFPVESYRWGYFGAERNYPRVMWHTGWYGDHVKTETWHGY